MASNVTKAFAEAWLGLLLNNVDITDVGDASGLVGSSSAGSLYLTMHTALPSGGDQASNETAYGGWQRMAVDRDAGGWGITLNVATNIEDLEFELCTSDPETITHCSVGVASSGSGLIFLVGELNQPIPVVVGSRPRILAGGLVLTVPTVD